MCTRALTLLDVLPHRALLTLGDQWAQLSGRISGVAYRAPGKLRFQGIDDYRRAEADGIGTVGRDGKLVDAALMRHAANMLGRVPPRLTAGVKSMWSSFIPRISTASGRSVGSIGDRGFVGDDVDGLEVGHTTLLDCLCRPISLRT